MSKTKYRMRVLVTYLVVLIITTSLVESDAEVDGYEVCDSEAQLKNGGMRQWCQKETFSECYLDRKNEHNDFCHREYRCANIRTRDLYNQESEHQPRLCGFLCWLMEKAFMDFPHTVPLNTTRFDVVFQSQVIDLERYSTIGYNNSDIEHSNMTGPNITWELARINLFRAMFPLWVDNALVNFTLLVKSRHCVDETPPVCEDSFRDDLAYIYSMEDTATLPECQTVLRLGPDAERTINVVESSESCSWGSDVASQCAVRIKCEFDAYFRQHGWSRRRWCFFMDWLATKAFRWLEIHDYNSIARESFMFLWVNGSNSSQEENFHIGGSCDILFPNKKIFFDRFMRSYGYSATTYRIYVNFKDCLHPSIRYGHHVPNSRSPCEYQWVIFTPHVLAMRQEETIPFCTLERFEPRRTPYRHEYCHRFYQCRHVTQEYARNDRGSCGILTWLWKRAFRDIPDGGTPYDEIRYDFSINSTNSSGFRSNYVLRNSSYDEARRWFFHEIYRLWENNPVFSFSLRTHSLDCTAGHPYIGFDRQFLHYDFMGRGIAPAIKSCTFPSEFKMPFRRQLEESQPGPFPKECAVRVECSLHDYFQRHGWSLYQMRQIMDWMFNKSTGWMGLDRNSNVSLYLMISLSAGGSDGRTFNISATREYRMAYLFYNEVMTDHAYFADTFGIYSVFNNCLSDDNHRARMEVQSPDHCMDTNFDQSSGTLEGGWIYYHHSFPHPRVVRTISECYFHQERMARRCKKLHLMYRLLTSYLSQLGNKFYLLMIANVSGGYQTIRELPQVRRDNALAYIKNFLAPFFTSVTHLQLEYQAVLER